MRIVKRTRGYPMDVEFKFHTWVKRKEMGYGGRAEQVAYALVENAKGTMETFKFDAIEFVDKMEIEPQPEQTVTITKNKVTKDWAKLVSSNEWMQIDNVGKLDLLCKTIGFTDEEAG